MKKKTRANRYLTRATETKKKYYIIIDSDNLNRIFTRWHTTIDVCLNHRQLYNCMPRELTTFVLNERQSLATKRKWQTESATLHVSFATRAGKF